MTFPPQTGQFGFFLSYWTPLSMKAAEKLQCCVTKAVRLDHPHQTSESGYFPGYLGWKEIQWTMVTRWFGVSFLKEVLDKLCPVIYLEGSGKNFFSLFNSFEVSNLCGKRAGSLLTVLYQIWTTNWMLKSIPENSAALLSLIFFWLFNITLENYLILMLGSVPRLFTLCSFPVFQVSQNNKTI